MSTYNLGLAYYRHYYDPKEWDYLEERPRKINPEDRNKKKEELQEAFFEKRSRVLLRQKIQAPDSDGVIATLQNTLGSATPLKLWTTYPGLLIGSGYAHGIGAQGEHKVGFYFDHTTGLPALPGSSVKGVLRSVFPSRVARTAENEEQMAGRYAFLRYLLTDPEMSIGLTTAQVTNSWIDALELEIFEGILDQANNLRLPLPYRDVFLDAFLSGPTGANFLGNDFITPHNKEKGNVPAALRNPVPIQFLKVLPGTEISFHFRLPEEQYYRNAEDQLVTRQNYRLSSTQKRKLFLAILLEIGVGAKTNVGYGQLVHSKAEVSGKTIAITENREPPQNEVKEGEETVLIPPSSPTAPLFNPDKHLLQVKQLKRGKQVLAQIVAQGDKELSVKLHLSDWDKTLSVKYFLKDQPAIGDWCWVTIKTKEGNGDKLRISLETNKVKPV